MASCTVRRYHLSLLKSERLLQKPLIYFVLTLEASACYLSVQYFLSIALLTSVQPFPFTPLSKKQKQPQKSNSKQAQLCLFFFYTMLMFNIFQEKSEDTDNELGIYLKITTNALFPYMESCSFQESSYLPILQICTSCALNEL